MLYLDYIAYAVETTVLHKALVSSDNFLLASIDAVLVVVGDAAENTRDI